MQIWTWNRWRTRSPHRETLTRAFLIILIPLAMIFTPMANAQPGAGGPPPIAAPLVREGDMAMKLVSGLGVGATNDEAEAESMLADDGILPRNGWIADYPVTPDIIGELKETIGNAAAAGKVPLSREEALKRFDDALASSGLLMAPYSPSGNGSTALADSANYPSPSAVNDYYASEGPPVITCYVPPPDFYYLYAWVPFPFWWSGFWFPGFFCLHDFHRTIIVNRRPVFVSNHFRDIREHRVFRVDPMSRFQGRTFGGIGASRSMGLLSTGVPRSERRIFNNPPPRNAVPLPRPSPDRRSIPSARGGNAAGLVTPNIRTMPSPAQGGARAMPLPSRSGEMTPPPRVSEPAAPPSRGAVEVPLSRGGEGVRPPFHGGGAVQPSPSHGSGSDRRGGR
jgi:hypothetical protein